jgi:hypothetical protein
MRTGSDNVVDHQLCVQVLVVPVLVFQMEVALVAELLWVLWMEDELRHGVPRHELLRGAVLVALVSTLDAPQPGRVHLGPKHPTVAEA